jgi:hypothetical protein
VVTVRNSLCLGPAAVATNFEQEPGSQNHDAKRYGWPEQVERAEVRRTDDRDQHGDPGDPGDWSLGHARVGDHLFRRRCHVEIMLNRQTSAITTRKE